MGRRRRRADRRYRLAGTLDRAKLTPDTRTAEMLPRPSGTKMSSVPDCAGSAERVRNCSYPPGSSGAPREGSASPIHVGIRRRRLRAASLGEPGQLAAPGGGTPGREVRRVQAFAPEQRAEGAGLRALRGGLQDLQM